MSTIDKIEYDFSDLDEYQIQELMHSLMVLYRQKVYKNIEDAELGELISIANTNRSSWSGGHCVPNMCEEIKRETALRILSDNHRR